MTQPQKRNHHRTLRWLVPITALWLVACADLGSRTGAIMNCYETGNGVVCKESDAIDTSPQDVNGDGIPDSFACADGEEPADTTQGALTTGDDDGEGDDGDADCDDGDADDGDADDGADGGDSDSDSDSDCDSEGDSDGDSDVNDGADDSDDDSEDDGDTDVDSDGVDDDMDCDPVVCEDPGAGDPGDGDGGTTPPVDPATDPPVQ